MQPIETTHIMPPTTSLPRHGHFQKEGHHLPCKLIVPHDGPTVCSSDVEATTSAMPRTLCEAIAHAASFSAHSVSSTELNIQAACPLQPPISLCKVKVMLGPASPGYCECSSVNKCCAQTMNSTCMTVSFHDCHHHPSLFS